MAVELRQIRYFVAVAEEGHITRAAERLGIQQPPLSQQIKALEKSLSVRLFDRLPRGVALTEAGQTLLEQARLLLAAAETAVLATQRAAKGEVGRLAVGLTSSSSLNPFVSRALRRFRESFPLVKTALEEGGTPELVEGLKRCALDVAFVRSRITGAAELEARPLLEEAMVAALPASHVLARDARKPLPLKRLSREPFVLYRRAIGAGLYDAIVTACGNAGYSPNVVQEAPRMLSTLSLVAAGLGVSVVPESMQSLAVDGVRYRALAGTGLRAPIILLARKENVSPAARQFMNLVRRVHDG